MHINITIITFIRPVFIAKRKLYLTFMWYQEFLVVKGKMCTDKEISKCNPM